MYSLGVANQGNYGCLTTAGSLAVLSSARIYGEGVNVGDIDVTANHDTVTIAGALTPEKTTSRSANPAGSYGSLNVMTAFVFSVTRDFSHQAWIPSWRIQPSALNGEAVAGNNASSSNLGSITSMLSESNFTYIKIFRRSRNGFFWRYGNEIHHHAKTGGGAFSQICPHFDNDIAWVHSDMYRNGIAQNSVWEINLFGLPTDTTSFIAPTLASQFGQPDTQSFQVLSV